MVKIHSIHGYPFVPGLLSCLERRKYTPAATILYGKRYDNWPYKQQEQRTWRRSRWCARQRIRGVGGGSLGWTSTRARTGTAWLSWGMAPFLVSTDGVAKFFVPKITIHPHTRDVRTHDRGPTRVKIGRVSKRVAYSFVRVSCDFWDFIFADLDENHRSSFVFHFTILLIYVRTLWYLGVLK